MQATYQGFVDADEDGEVWAGREVVRGREDIGTDTLLKHNPHSTVLWQHSNRRHIQQHSQYQRESAHRLSIEQQINSCNVPCCAVLCCTMIE